MRTLASVAVVVFLILAAAQAGEEGALKKELEALRGNWNVVNGAKAADQDVVTQWSMVENTLQIRMGGATIDLKFTVHPAKKPKEIDLITLAADGSDKTMLGIYKLEGDTLEIRVDDFGKKRPTEFKAKAGFVFKREKKKGK